MPMNGPAIAGLGIGTLLLYSAIKGKSILATVQSVIIGQSPANVAPTEQITSPTPPADVKSKTGGAGLVNAAPTPTGSEKSWIDSFLTAVGAPTTGPNEQSLTAWIAHEGDFATSGNNALNTTQPNSDSIGVKNSIGVQIFRTPSGGVNANATALLNGLYPDILMLLRSGNGLCGQSLKGLSTWSGGGYSSVC